MTDLAYLAAAPGFFLIAALNFLPALALGPIIEHFLMLKGNGF